MVCGSVLFIDQLKVVGVGPVDDGFCSFGCLDIRVPPRVMCIEVSNNDSSFREWDVGNTSFHGSFVLVWCLGSFIVDIQEECRWCCLGRKGKALYIRVIGDV